MVGCQPHQTQEEVARSTVVMVGFHPHQTQEDVARVEVQQLLAGGWWAHGSMLNPLEMSETVIN